MQTLKSDLLGAMRDTKREQAGQTLLDIVGAYSDGSTAAPIVVDISSAINEISVGGQTVAPGAQVQIQLNQDGILLDCKRTCIVGEITLITGVDILDAFIPNLADLFECYQVQLGSYSWSMTEGKYYQKCKFAKRGIKARKLQRQLACKMEDIAVGVSYDGLDTGANQWLGLQHQLRLNKFACMVNGKIRFAIPLDVLAPCLEAFPNSNIWLGQGQMLKMQMRTNQAEDIMCSGNLTNSYRLDNVQIAKVYSRLDPVRYESVIKSSLSMPCRHFINYSINQCSASMNLIHNIGEKDRVIGLYFGFFSNKKGLLDSGDATAENIFSPSTSGANPFTSSRLRIKMHSAPLPIQTIFVDLSGYTYQFNMQSLQAYEVMQQSLGDEEDTFTNPLQKQLNTVYFLDLRRFSEDAYGSSSKQISGVKTSINLRPDVKTVHAQFANWASNELDRVPGFDGYQLQSFLEVQREIDLTNGVYK